MSTTPSNDPPLDGAHPPAPEPARRRALPSLTHNAQRLLRRATGRALMGTLLGSLPGFLLPFAITARMHVGHLTDAYAFSLGVALFASTLCVGVLQTNVLPVMQQMKTLGRAAFLGRLRTIVAQALGISTLFYAAIAIVALTYINGQAHWTSQQQELLLATAALLTLFVLASAVNGVLSAGLNSLNSFFSPAATQALRSIVPLSAIAFVSRDNQGLIVIAALVAGGELVRTAVLAHQLRRSAGALSDEPAPRDYASEMPLWRVAAPVALASLIAAASPMIDRSVAASLPAGSVTYVDLGERVFQVPLTIISTSLVLVAGTYWASIRTSDVPRLSSHVRRTLIRGSIVCVALLAAMLIGLAAVSLIAGSTLAGASTSKLISIVAILLAGLPGAFIVACGARFFTSTRTTYLLPAFGVVYFTTNLGFDIVGAHLFGVQGIALSSTLCRWVNALLYLIVIKRLLGTSFNGLALSWHRKPIPIQDSPP